MNATAKAGHGSEKSKINRQKNKLSIKALKKIGGKNIGDKQATRGPART